MQETAQAILDLLAANNGTMLYPELYEQLAYEQRGHAMDALRYLRDTGKIRKYVARGSDGKMSHIVETVTG